ncbi:MAG: excinuclease ABC subunit UvrC [Methanomicrobiales archaeon]|jgi:excinuclease ABC subunit C|nr:excinuclease ABC subunit UvrC [Methanomicrobiales archaeon]
MILADLPHDPGCYLFRDEHKEIIYIGKAKDLKRRVSSYFQKTHHDTKTKRLVSQIADIDFIVTSSEVEALLLESTLIKKHRPQYNIALKDSRGYAYIALSGDVYPRISVVRTKDPSSKIDGGKAKKATYFGPFVSARERDQILYFAKKTFKLRSCKNLKKHPCLRYHLDSCAGPCTGKVSEQEYAYQVKCSEKLLQGKNTELLSEMKENMQQHSDNLAFEKALQLRDQIKAIEHLSERQYVLRDIKEHEHIIHYACHADQVYLMLFSVERGCLTHKEEFVFEKTEEFLDEFLIQYYTENLPPHTLILPEEVDDSMEEYLSKKRGSKVTITVPKRGDKRRLLSLVSKNIGATFFKHIIRVDALGEALNLQAPPSIIECFDVSHLSGTGTVGAMVRFMDGKPDKRNYRRYKLKSYEGSDDLLGIAELVRRRYTRLLEEESPLPDLIVVDGGKGQLQAAHQEMKALNLQIPLISLAKREEEIYSISSQTPLPIKRNSEASLLLQEIRNEAHRFAITYQRVTRSKKQSDEIKKGRRKQKR